MDANVTTGSLRKNCARAICCAKLRIPTWHCGDPGMQYDTTINRWHTCKNTARINASNPCSEYMFLDDTACNLASLNLMKFLGSNGQFDVTAFKHAVDVTITAQEILVDNASYPTPRIAREFARFPAAGHRLRQPGRAADVAGAALRFRRRARFRRRHHRVDDRRSLRAIGAHCGAHGSLRRAMQRIAKPMLDVIRMHRDALRPIKEEHVQPSLLRAARKAWDDALELGEKFGYKNSQVTVLAPTGTIGFMMDCDTTGIEPDLALVKQKKLVGGGVIKIVNNTVPQALMKLGYPPEQISADRGLHRRQRENRRRARAESRALAGFRLLALADGRRAVDRVARTLAHDGGGAAISFRRDQQDHQHAGRIHGGRHHAGVHRIVEVWA